MNLTAQNKVKLKRLFKSLPLIKLVYLFGSQAREDDDIGSDYDFAAYIDPRRKSASFDILLDLSARIPLILKTNSVDVVVINAVDNLILKNNIVSEGIVIYEVPGCRLNLELGIVGEYRDFRILESMYYPD